MIAMTTTACTPQVQQYRNLFRTAAVRAIGKVPSEIREGGTTLNRSAIPAYLVSIGCPVLLDGPPSLMMIKDANLLTAVDEAAKTGNFDDAAGLALQGDRLTAIKYCIVTASEFLRRKRTVAWRSAEDIIASTPRRVIQTDEDVEINDEFFMLSEVYELLVIDGVQTFGHTEAEERMIGKMLSCRLTMFLPTVVVLIPPLGSSSKETSAIAQYLVDNYLTVDV